MNWLLDTGIYDNELVFLVTLLIVPGFLFYGVLKVLVYFWPGLSLQNATVVAVSVAACTAVMLHELHTHSRGHFAEEVELCIERPNCIDAVLELSDELEEEE